MYVIVARFYAKEGVEDEVAEVLQDMIPHALSEPGCRQYSINRSVDDPRRFLLYEQYLDEAAFKAHTETEAFKQHILGRVVPQLDDRSREVYTLIDATVPAGR
jgi:quinol monooxygenase YgiN